MPMGPVQEGLAQRMGGGGPPPGPPPGMAGPPPGPGGPQMMGQPPPPGMEGAGGDPVQQIAELLQAALMLTVQAGPEAFGMGGIKQLWTGVFGALDKRMAPMRQGQGGGQGMPPQAGPPPGMAGPPPQGMGAPPPGPPPGPPGGFPQRP